MLRTDLPPLPPDLVTLLDTDELLTEGADLAPYLVDHRKLYQGHARAVVLPRSVAKVAAVIRCCAQHGIGVVPQGGNTGYCGGATPDESGTQIVLALKRLNAVRSIDADNFSMTVEAGCTLEQVQRAAEDAGRFFPLALGSQGSCQIGGNLATNAGGLNVLRFGMTRELVLGIEAVLPDGSLFEGLTALRKDNTGYDLKSLLIGAEGTLGVITAATLKLWPQMRSHAAAFVAIPDVRSAVALLALLRATAGERLNSFELIPRVGIDLTTRFIPGVTDPLDQPHHWYILCELSSPSVEPLDALLQQALGTALEQGLALDAALAQNERQRLAFWRLRESIPEAQRHAGPSLKHDISVPVHELPDFVAAASHWVAEHVPDGVLVCYGHAGDGNLHFNINRTDGFADASFLAREPVVKRAIHELVHQFHGSISAEHGIGRLKVEELERYAPPAELAAMRAIKAALDPKGIMNPGKVLREPHHLPRGGPTP
ncbi:MAG: FAD-binding oxidoreductase [Steroidobacteraceae bacterium]